MASENRWGSNLTFVLAMIGSAVGLGNIWRYPYVLYSNGGGAFYIPYLVAILTLAIPFLILEYGVGYHYQSSFTKAIVKIKPKLEVYGWILPVVVFIMTVYYSTIMGWDGIYLFLSFFKGWGADPNTYLNVNLLHSVDSLGGITNFLPFVAIVQCSSGGGRTVSNEIENVDRENFRCDVGIYVYRGPDGFRTLSCHDRPEPQK